jgi:hypothetical protein
MSLIVLSKDIVRPEETLERIVVSSLRMNLYFSMSEGALKEDGAIQSINIKSYFGNGEDDFELLLTDILSMKHSMESKQMGTFNFCNMDYCPILATDYAPSKLSYIFSLAYLRLCPTHLISIYEHVFALNEIEAIEEMRIYSEEWYYRFAKLH